MSTVHAAAKHRTVIRKRNHSSMITDYHFTFDPPSPGTLEVIASQWIFPGTPRRVPLQARHTVRAGMWNTFFEMAVIPENDVTVTFTDADFAGSPRLFSKAFGIALVILSILIAVVATWVIFGNP